jgi:hypothetical protein
LKEGLVKFQVYLEGAEFLAITDHAALTWSKTYHNVNQRVVAWGTVFSAFPGIKIVHQPGKANVLADAVSRLRQEVPPMISPLPDGSTPLRLNSDSVGLTNLYKELGDKFKNQVMEVASALVLANQIGVPEEYVLINLENSSNYITTKSFSLLVHTSESEVKKFMDTYYQDPHCSKVYKALRENYHPMNPPFSQYQVGDNGLLYFIDWAEKLRLCVPKDLLFDIIKENHDEISNGAHAGYAKTYNQIASVYYWPKMSQNIKKYMDTCDICNHWLICWFGCSNQSQLHMYVQRPTIMHCFRIYLPFPTMRIASSAALLLINFHLLHLCTGGQEDSTDCC